MDGVGGRREMPELMVAVAAARRVAAEWGGGGCAEEGPGCECGGITGRD